MVRKRFRGDIVQGVFWGYVPERRARLDRNIQVIQNYIYKLLTQPQLQVGPPSPLQPKTYQMLPHARRGAIAGLLELLNDHGGKLDLY